MLCYYVTMLRLTVLTFLSLPFVVLAHQPWLITFEKYEDTFMIEDTQVSKAYYVDMTGFPHNYEFSLGEKREVFLEILVPDIGTVDDVYSGTLVKKNRNKIELVDRMEAKTAEWESFYEVHGGDSYRRGGSFRGELEAGDYLLEMSSPDNLGKYVLVVGELEDFSDLSMGELYKRIYEIKKFYNKPFFAVLQSPYYYIPFGLLVLIGGLVYFRRRRA